ncbi:hypothetical protein Tco_0158053 [Tanacetum coccineum]
MAEQNVPAQPPTRTDEQIVPRSQWLTIGKSNLLFNAQKIQRNPIFQISLDILSNTNFFQAFTASANVPAIYLQQFWKTMSYNKKTGVYSCQVDEQWFDLSADLLRKALAITPVELNMGRSLQHGIQTFFSHKASHNASLKNPKKKVTPLLNHLWTVFQMISQVCSKGESVEVFGNAIPDPTDNDASFNNPRIIPTYQTLPIETGPSSQPNDETSEKVIHESSSTSDSERTESETEAAAPKGDQDQGEVDSSTVTSGVSIHVSDPEKAHEALAGPDLSLMKKTDWIRLWKIYMCLLLDQTLSTWMKNSSPQPTQ